MPISQKTMLTIYGELCDLAEMGEKLAQMIAQGDLLMKSSAKRKAVEQAALVLALAAQRRQINALALILTDEPAINANPLTGRIS